VRSRLIAACHTCRFIFDDSVEQGSGVTFQHLLTHTCCWRIAGITALWLLAAPGQVIAGGMVHGSYRNLLFHVRDSTGTALTSDLNRLRLEWEGDTSQLAWHVAYDHELLYGGLVGSPDFTATARLPEPTWLDAEHIISAGGRHDWRHRLYRAWLRFEGEHAVLVVGRQRIAWGAGRIWNPTDRFNPVDPTSLESSEKTGVDALIAAWRYSGFGAVQLVVAPGQTSHRASRKFALRWRDTFCEADISLTAGRIGVERVIGGDVAANIMEGTFRLEAMRAWPRHGQGFAQISIGYDYTLANSTFPAGLHLLAEYFYNGAPGDAPSLTPVDRLYSRARHTVGAVAGYDLTPLWRLEGMLIWEASNGSRFFLPKLTWSASEDVDVTAFALLFGGGQASEFGRRENTYALQADVYF